MPQRPAVLTSLLLAAALTLGGNAVATAAPVEDRQDSYHSKWCGFLFLRWC
jgi:hypothetical protein